VARAKHGSVWLLWIGAVGLGVAAQAGGAEWTVLAYLSGDGSLEQTARHYAHVLAAVPGSARVGIAVQIDRGPGFSDEAGGYEDARRVVLQTTAAGVPRRWRWSGWRAEVNMGDPATLVEFLAWGAQAVPAEKYLVLLVGHGSGVRPFVAGSGGRDQGVAYDATSDGDSLAPEEFSAAGPAIVRALGGQRIELLAIDACFSASAEVATEVASIAGMMAGSPNLLYEPGVPWGSVLGELCEREGLTGETVAVRAVGAVQSADTATGAGKGSYSAARLSGVAELETALRELSDALCRSMPQAAPAVTAARAKSARGGLSEEMLDLRAFLQALAEEAEAAELPEISGRAVAAGQALGAMVVVSYAGERDEHGEAAWTWATFFPPNLTEFPADYLDTGRFARQSGWGAFLEAYLGHLQRLLWGT